MVRAGDQLDFDLSRISGSRRNVFDSVTIRGPENTGREAQYGGRVVTRTIQKDKKDLLKRRDIKLGFPSSRQPIDDRSSTSSGWETASERSDDREPDAPPSRQPQSTQVRRSRPPTRSRPVSAPTYKFKDDSLEGITTSGLVPIREEELSSSSTFEDLNELPSRSNLDKLGLLRSRRAKPTPLRPGESSVGSVSDFSRSSGLTDFTDDTQSDFVSSSGLSDFTDDTQSDFVFSSSESEAPGQDPRLQLIRRSNRNRNRNFNFRPSGALSLRSESSRASTPSELRYSSDFDSESSQSFNTISTLGDSDISVGSSRALTPSTDFSEFSDISSAGSSFVSVEPPVVPVSELPDAPTGDASRVIAVSPDFEDDEIQGLTGQLPDVPDFDLGDDIYTAPAVAPPGGLGELVEFDPGSSPSLQSVSSGTSSRASDFQQTFIPIQDVRYSSSSGRSSIVSGTTSPGFFTPGPEPGFSPVQQTPSGRPSPSSPQDLFTELAISPESDDPELSRLEQRTPRLGRGGVIARPDTATPDPLVGEKIVGSTRRAIVPSGFERDQRFFRQRTRRATDKNKVVRPTAMRFTDMGQDEAVTDERFSIPMRSSQYQRPSRETSAFERRGPGDRPGVEPPAPAQAPRQVSTPSPTAEEVTKRRAENEGGGAPMTTAQQRRYRGRPGREIPEGAVQFKAQLLETQQSNKNLKREIKSIAPTLKLNIFNNFTDEGVAMIQYEIEQYIDRNSGRMTAQQIGLLNQNTEMITQNNLRIRDLQNKIRGSRAKR